MKTLKGIIIALVAMLASFGSAQAGIINFGIKAGMNVNKLSFNQDMLKSSNSVGWTAGVMADIHIPLLGFGADVSAMYARMNNSTDITNTQTNASGNGEDFGKNFIEIPVNIKYTFTLPVVGNAMKPYIFTGPNFAFKLDKNTIDAMKSKTFQLAWNVGIGFEFFNHLQVGASYGFGCNNVVDFTNKIADTSVNTVDSKVKNNYWTVTAAYVF